MDSTGAPPPTNDGAPSYPPLPGQSARGQLTESGPQSPGRPLPPAEPSASSSVRWFHSWFVILVCLAGCLPIGMLLLWTSPHPPMFKRGVSVLFLIFVGIALWIPTRSQTLTSQLKEFEQFTSSSQPAATSSTAVPTDPASRIINEEWEQLDASTKQALCELNATSDAAADLLSGSSNDPRVRMFAIEKLRLSC